MIFIGLIFIAFGLAQIHFKDLWWWDNVLLWNYLGKSVERTEAWEHQQDTLGIVCVASGLFVLVYHLITLF